MVRIPGYRLHKPSGRQSLLSTAKTTISVSTARMESKVVYDRLIAEYNATGQATSLESTSKTLPSRCWFRTTKNGLTGSTPKPSTTRSVMP